MVLWFLILHYSQLQARGQATHPFFSPLPDPDLFVFFFILASLVTQALCHPFAIDTKEKKAAMINK